ncbi:hypothetical protein M3M33_15765, partial [Loigolactobacillus coryniformis]|uniref:hypothetical protein n=1 Tax=Loigolactobacillus coryniformis TaxID=1610 RepID=UPI00201A66C8
GKTYLARAIWNWYRKSEFFRASVGADIIYPGTWCDWPELAGRLQSNQGYEQVQELSTEKLVVLDEIGADRDKNGHVKDQLARL